MNEANITECLRQYQTAAPLSIAELWLFPLLLRMALFESLARLADRVNRAQQLREVAYLWANRLAAGMRRGTEEFEKMLARLDTEPFALEPCFVTSLAERLQDEENTLGPVQRWIEDRGKTPLTDLVRSEHSDEASQRISTANAFGSLRALSRIDFTEIFEAVSLVDAELRNDPSGVYAQSDFATRDRCRRAVERIALESGLAELDVARRATTLAARRDAASSARTTHAPYYLLAEGVAELEAAAGARVPLQIRLIRALRRQATLVYLTAVASLSAPLLALALAVAWEEGVHQRTMLAVLGALALFPLGELSIQIVNALVISLLPPDLLPKMDFRKGIPPEYATLVVVPMMLSSLEVVQQEVEKLEVRSPRKSRGEPPLRPVCRFHRFRGTGRSYGCFPAGGRAHGHRSIERALSHEYRRSGRAVSPLSPAACLVGERAALDRMGEKARQAGRPQQFAGRWRKPGDAGCGQTAAPIRYVITLDADTQLPVSSARRLVETIAHPLNRVEIDPVTRTRKRGFTIIQPRVSIALPGATATRFTRVFADTSGTDPYCQSVSDAQQDLFGEAIFHGKAIYDVQAFRTTVGDRFPAETLLSHDLIEGAHVGVALASDIELFENLPLSYASYCQRQHRWIRGDWQIAPWILPRVPAPGGKREPNPLTIVNRWRILDNLRRTLVPVASLLLLLFGWLISAAPGAWSLVVGLAIVIPGFAPLLDRLARHIQGSVRGWQGAADELVRAAVLIAFLPHQAWLSVDADRARGRIAVSSAAATCCNGKRRRARAHRRTVTPASFSGRWLSSPALSLLLTVVLCVKHAFAPTSALSRAVGGVAGADALARPAGSFPQARPHQRPGQALPPPSGAPDLALFRRSGQCRTPTGCPRIILNWRCASKSRNAPRRPISDCG